MEIVNRHPFKFYGAQLLMRLTDQNEILLPLSDLCEVIGLNVTAETRRIRRDVVLRDALVVIKESPVYKGFEPEQKFACLPLRLLPYWVGTINIARIEPQLRKRIIRFKQQLADLTWIAFRSRVFPIDVWTMVDTPFPPKGWE